MKCNKKVSVIRDIRKTFFKMFQYTLVVRFILLLTIIIGPIYGYVYLNTTLGPVKGTTMLSRKGKLFYAFLGLPFAEPPLGDLRFKNPIPYTRPWNFTYDATQQPEICAQNSLGWTYKGSEDCLYLNLYTSQLPSNNSTKLAVWFFIYPGRRLFGDPTTQRYGPHYIMDEPVIFVSASYRVGAFGFLSTEDDAVPGNFGLKDQAAALLWINRYISDYGGDPNRVTIAGESSGAVDVALHLFSPITKPLFHRAILQSGFCLSFRAISQPGKSRIQAWKLAAIVGCKNKYVKTSEDLADCLRMIPANVLTTSLAFMMHDYILPHTYFGIVIEDPNSQEAFLTSHPIVEIHKPSNKTLLMGVNTNEAHQKSLGFYAYPTKDKVLKKKVLDYVCDNFNRIFPILLGFDHLPNQIQIVENVRQKYFPSKRIQDGYHEVSTAYGIATVHLGMIDAALKYNGEKYFYHYDHLNAQSYRRVYDISFGLYIKEPMGVVHGEEFRSLFYQPFLLPPVLNGDDRIVSERIVKMWSNFVIYGNPNGMNAEQTWKPVITSDVEYIYINKSQCLMKSKPFWDDYLFWKTLGNPPLINSSIYETIFLGDLKRKSAS